MLRSLCLIAAIVGTVAIAFAYTAGWLSPNRLTPAKLVAAAGAASVEEAFLRMTGAPAERE